MPSSPFDEGFDGKVGEVANAGAFQGAQDGAPKAVPAASVAPKAQGVTSGAPPARSGNIQAKPRVAEPAPAVEATGVPVDFDSSDIKQLLKYMMMDQAQKMEERTAALQKQAHLRKQREANAKEQDSKTLVKQARCQHLKGRGRSSKNAKSGNKDYSVYRFQFINFLEYIRCRICGMKWFQEDTKEYLVRQSKDGKKHKISNHTKIGWVEAIEMTESSTDTMGTSERIHNASPNFVDPYGRQFEGRLVDTETGEMVEGVTI